MSYSRRQLYAFGEPLGDGATRREVGGKIVYGGGGGGTPEKQTTVVDIPDWAKPYAKESLGKAAALTSTPYQTYGGERIAQFTPMQKQAFGRAEGQEVASQIGAGSGLAGTAGLMGLTGGYQPGQFGSQMSQYMSPYMDAVVQRQMDSAQRQADIAGTQRGAQAVRAGAFGGSRQAIENAEAARALASQKGQIQEQGLQSAFERAQQQFNTEQALAEQSRQAGLGTALQSAQALGQLGQQQFGQQMGITEQQAQFGGQQRQATQDILSQQYQDFLNQQRSPYDQLSFMSSLIRGTPMGQTTTQYAPPPSTTSQLIGLGTAAAGAYGAYKGAAGGSVPSYASGGKLNLEGTFEVADGGGGLGGGGMFNNMQQGNQSPLGRNPSLAVLPQDMMFSAQPAVMPQGGNFAAGGIASLSQPEIAAAADGMSDQQLQQTQGLPSITELARMTLAAEAQQRAQMRQAAAAQQAMMAQQPQATVAEEQMAALGGISDLPAPNLENLGEGMAGGGIIAFQAGGPIRLPAGTPPQEVERVRMENPGQEVMVETAGIGALPLYTTPTGMTKEMAAASGIPAGVQELMRQRRTLVEETGQQGIRAAEANLANIEKDQKEMGPIGAEREKRNLAQEKKLEGAEGKNFNMALIQAGLAIMAGNSANAFENIGKGAMVGTEAYTKGMERIQSRKEKLDESIATLDELRFSGRKADKAEVRNAVNNVNTAKTALGTSLSSLLGEEGKMAADAYTSQETRKATYASANKPTDQRNFVNDYVAAARAEGDTTTPDSVLRKKGAIAYLSTVGMSGVRADIAGQTADINAQRAQAGLIEDAQEYVDKQIGYGGTQRKKFRDLQTQDKIDGTNTAQEFVDQLRQGYINRASATSPAVPASAAGAGTAQSPLPMPANAASARVGMIYNTARGPARWDGSSFIPVQ
jgi:hypothetical protein